jgi:bacterioferritin-associated ferredoxin
MYVCICNAIREKDLAAAALQCPGDVDAVYAFLDCQPQCGQCLDEAAHVLIEAREKAKTSA